MSTGCFPLVCDSETGYLRDVPNLLIQRLEKLLKDTGRSARDVSMKATGSPDAIRDILRKKTTSPRADTISRLAKELGVSTPYLTGETEAPAAREGGREANIVPAPIVGKVQAGAFMEVDLDAQGEPEAFVSTVPDKEYPRLGLFAYEVVGDSINRKCEEGGYAMCVDFASTGLEIKDGMWVVVERHRGGLVERTIKRVKVERGRYELWPESTNPAHKPIKFPSATPHEEVKVTALVRHFISPTQTW